MYATFVIVIRRIPGTEKKDKYMQFYRILWIYSSNTT